MKIKLFLFFCLVCSLLTACSKSAPDKFSFTASEAMRKFQTLCKDSGYTPVIRMSGSTLWIYFPLREPLMDIKAGQPVAPAASAGPKIGESKNSLVYWDVAYQDREFTINYANETRRTYPSNMNYKTAYTEPFQKKQQAVLSMLTRSFYDADEPPEFVVFLAADIERGMTVKIIFNFEDMRKISSVPPSLSQDEYAKRFISEVNGDTEAVDDEQGRHLDWAPLSWPEFLRRQIKHRIAFKYQQSTFPPSEDTKTELARIARDTLKAYDFQDYDAIVLEDLDSGELFKIE